MSKEDRGGRTGKKGRGRGSTTNLVIEKRGADGRDEELAAVGVGAGVLASVLT